MSHLLTKLVYIHRDINRASLFLSWFFYWRYEMNNHNYEIGTVCGRNNCTGILHSKAEDISCNCHINPPCSKCTAGIFCSECGFDSDEEYRENNPENTSNQFTLPELLKYSFMTFEEKCKKANDNKIVTHQIESCLSCGKLQIRYPKNITLDDVLRKLGYCHINLPKFSNHREDDKFFYADLSVVTD